MKRGLSDMYFLGRKCIFCDKYGLYKLKDKRVKCSNCSTKYSLSRLRRNLEILYYFYLEISARKASLLFKGLKKKGNIVEFRDIFTASICIINNLKLATFSKRHFERMKEFGLVLLD